MDRRRKLDFPRKFGSTKKLSGLLFLFLISIKNNANFCQFMNRRMARLIFTYVSVTKVCTTQIQSTDCIMKIKSKLIAKLEIDNCIKYNGL